MWVHVAVVGLALTLCATVWTWSSDRGEQERRATVRQASAVATVLVQLYAEELLEQLGPVERGAPRLAPSCPPCIVRNDGQAAIDLLPLLQAMARAAGAGANTLAVVASGRGERWLVGPNGPVRDRPLHLADAAQLLAGPMAVDVSEADGTAWAISSLPVGPDMAIAVALDLSQSLAAQVHRRRQDQVWAVGTCLLLLMAASGCSFLAEWMARRDRRLSDDRVALTLANAELKHARDRARASSFELQTIFTSMSDGVSHFDPELRLVQWNQRFPDLAGVPLEALRSGMDVADVLRIQAERGEFGPMADRAAVEREVARRMEVLSTTTPLHMIERPRPDGRTVELRRTSLPNGGFVTIYTDVTVRKQAEAAQETARIQAERANQEKARFVAIVSHEIRTPLNVILNALGLIDRDALPPVQRHLVETGVKAGDALLALLNDILDLSRLESGRLPIVSASFALRPVVEGVAEMYRHVAMARGIRITVEVDAAVPERVHADCVRVRQMLMNLVSNAAKFADPGAACIHVGLTPAERPRLRFAVMDQGPAIPDQERAGLFRPFSQLESDRSDRPVGSGLGLAICSMLAERMGGAIGAAARSLEGRPSGNEFWFTLPLDDAEPSAAEPSHEALARRMQPINVLVVEDMPANRLLLGAMLKRDGHDVAFADTGAEAIDAVARQDFDIVLMDVRMPGMNGIEATRRIRALDGPRSALPIVGVTADSSDEDRADCVGAGMTDVITKPVSRAILDAALQNHALRSGVPRRLGLQVLDAGRAGNLPAGDELLRSCLHDLGLQLSELEDAARRGDVAMLSGTAHAMAGVAGNYGFQVLEHRLRPLVDVKLIDPDVAGMVGLIADDLRRARRALASARLVSAA